MFIAYITSKLILQEYAQYVHHHPLKHCGLPVVLAPLLIYSDDTTGNRSKNWNKFDLWCVTLSCLQNMRPGSLNIHLLLVQTNSLQLK